MDITFQISDEQWSKLTENIDIESLLTEEDIKEGLKEAIKNYFNQDSVRKDIRNMIFNDSYYNAKLSDQGLKILQGCIEEEEFKDLKDHVMTTLKENSTEILANSFAHLFLTNITQSYEFQQAMQLATEDSMLRIKNDLYTKCGINLDN